MQEHVIKDIQRITKGRRFKIKGPFRPYFPSLVPGHALFWRALLEDETRS